MKTQVTAGNIPPHVQLILENTEVGMASTSVTRALEDPTQRHAVPGLLMDLYGAVDALIEKASHLDPAISLAWAAGLRSTRDISDPEIIDFTLGQQP